MKLLKKLKKIKNLATVDKTDGDMEALLQFLGIDCSATKDISQATYYACLKTLSEAIGKLPLKLMTKDDNGGIREAREHYLYSVIRYRPNPYMTATTFWASVEYNRNHYGNAYVAISGYGKKTNLWLLDSSCMQIYYDDQKLLAENEDIYYIYRNGGKEIRFKSADILHFKSHDTFSGLKGKSVRDRLKDTMTSGKKSQKMLNNLYDNGFSKKVAIEYTSDLNEENEKTFLQKMDNYVRGRYDNIKNVLPVPFGSKLTTLDLNLAEAQFLELKQYTALQIASAFGIKPYQIGDYTKSSYASEEMQQLSFYKDTLLFILKQYEEELAYKLLTENERKNGLYFRFNVSAMLRTDTKTQMEVLSKGVQSFIIEVNEAREQLELPNYPDGNKLIGNGAYIPLEKLGSQYNNK